MKRNGIYEGMMEKPTISIPSGGGFPGYRSNLARLLNMPEHKVSSEAVGVGGKYNVHKVPYSEMDRLFGDYIGWRMDNEILVSMDYKGEPLNRDSKIAHFLHEYFAGFNHERTDEQAQAEALDFTTALTEIDPRYAPVVNVIRAENKRLGFSRN